MAQLKPATPDSLHHKAKSLLAANFYIFCIYGCDIALPGIHMTMNIFQSILCVDKQNSNG